MSVKRYEVNGSSSVLEDETGSLVDYEDYAALEQRLIESERYGRQTDITIDNLEMKLAQMAAELASVKQQEPKAWFIRITDEVTVDAREGEKWRGVPLVRVDVETPNHDAFLAEVRAQGVEAAIDTAKNVVAQEFQYKDFETAQRVCSKFPESDLVGKVEMVEWLEDFAAQLRKGVQS